MVLYIGLDVGTQSTKAVVWSLQEGKVVSRGAAAYDIIRTDVPGRAEQHPGVWLEVGRLEH